MSMLAGQNRTLRDQRQRSVINVNQNFEHVKILLFSVGNSGFHNAINCNNNSSII